MRKPRILQKSEPFGWVLQAEKDISTFKHMLAGSSEFPNVVSEIFNALHSRGLPVEKMSYSHAPAGKGNLNLVKYTTTLSTSGPYSELKAFLADILDSGRLLYIENLTLVNRSKRKESVALNIVLSTFFLDTRPESFQAGAGQDTYLHGCTKGIPDNETTREDPGPGAESPGKTGPIEQDETPFKGNDPKRLLPGQGTRGPGEPPGRKCRSPGDPGGGDSTSPGSGEAKGGRRSEYVPDIRIS
ncbi:MAG: type 4a pilus biogenesis protein PilO [Deltaproteobacteria bacterium]|nr:type 4a pilus biogenesis protein PilO [Deltaproteobacteria bacterium]